MINNIYNNHKIIKYIILYNFLRKYFYEIQDFR